MAFETRDFALEIKTLTETGEIVGLASPFGNVDHGNDIVAPGAYAKSIAAHKAAGTSPAMLLHHSLDRPVGKWSEFSETSEGLLVKGNITRGAPDGAEAYALARDGALTGLSPGYMTKQAGRQGDARLLMEIEVFEVSLVSVPMNSKARISMVKTINNVSDIQELLRDGGLSGRKSRAAAAAAWAALNNSQSEAEAEQTISEILKASAARIAAI
jgi:HK97 family phage prohead protease